MKLSPLQSFALFFALSCAGDEAAPEAQADAAPEADTTGSSTTSTLARSLYAGETGALAAQAGDRARILVWLRGLSLSPTELGMTCAAAEAVAATRERAAAEHARLAEAESAALTPHYEALAARLLAGPLDEAEAASWAARIDAAREGLGDPLALERAAVEAALGEATRLQSALGRREGLGGALFLLRREVSDGARPGLYEGVLGRPWDPGDFASLRRASAPVEPGQLDVGGLWSLEAGDWRLLPSLSDQQVRVILTLALDHPETAATCRALEAATIASPTPP
ncbi:MAG: hypothetical protein RIT28_4685 [Pseudomonadota bacterium]